MTDPATKREQSRLRVKAFYDRHKGEVKKATMDWPTALLVRVDAAAKTRGNEPRTACILRA
jgi:hypothetical protein